MQSRTKATNLRLISGELRFYDPQTGKRLLSHKETEQALQQTELALQQAEQSLQQEAQARAAEAQVRRDAIPRLLGLGLSVEQVAGALGLSVEEVRRFIQD